MLGTTPKGHLSHQTRIKPQRLTELIRTSRSSAIALTRNTSGLAIAIAIARVCRFRAQRPDGKGIGKALILNVLAVNSDV